MERERVRVCVIEIKDRVREREGDNKIIRPTLSKLASKRPSGKPGPLYLLSVP